jgi:hypothetical protein
MVTIHFHRSKPERIIMISSKNEKAKRTFIALLPLLVLGILVIALYVKFTPL